MSSSVRTSDAASGERATSASDIHRRAVSPRRHIRQPEKEPGVNPLPLSNTPELPPPASSLPTHHVSRTTHRPRKESELAASIVHSGSIIRSAPDLSLPALVTRHKYLLVTMTILVVLCIVYLYFAVSMGADDFRCQGLRGDALVECREGLMAARRDAAGGGKSGVRGDEGREKGADSVAIAGVGDSEVQEAGGEGGGGDFDGDARVTGRRGRAGGQR